MGISMVTGGHSLWITDDNEDASILGASGVICIFVHCLMLCVGGKHSNLKIQAARLLV